MPSADAITAVFIPKTADASTSATDQAALEVEQPLIAPIPATRKFPAVVEEAVPPPSSLRSKSPAIDPVQTAGIDAVDEFIESGKQLPSYISDAEPRSRRAAVEAAPTARS